MFRFYTPSILFAAGTSLVKFLLAIPQDQFLHGGIICWGYIQNSIVVLNEGISPLIYHRQYIFQHDDVIKWKHFPRYWPFVRRIHRSPVNSPHKGQWRGALMFSLICTRINDWVNNREAGDLRRHQAHCDVIVMERMKIRHLIENPCKKLSMFISRIGKTLVHNIH